MDGFLTNWIHGWIQENRGKEGPMENQTIPLDECRVSLLNRKKDLLNRLDLLRRDFSERQTQGDEADQSVALIKENRMFINKQRIRK